MFIETLSEFSHDWFNWPGNKELAMNLVPPFSHIISHRQAQEARDLAEESERMQLIHEAADYETAAKLLDPSTAAVIEEPTILQESASQTEVESRDEIIPTHSAPHVEEIGTSPVVSASPTPSSSPHHVAIQQLHVQHEHYQQPSHSQRQLQFESQPNQSQSQRHRHQRHQQQQQQQTHKHGHRRTVSFGGEYTVQETPQAPTLLKTPLHSFSPADIVTDSSYTSLMLPLHATNTPRSRVCQFHI